MIANKPNFTDSELYFIEGVIEEDRKRWIDNFENSRDFEEIKNEYDSILEKIKNWRKEEHYYNKVIITLPASKAGFPFGFPCAVYYLKRGYKGETKIEMLQCMDNVQSELFGSSCS